MDKVAAALIAAIILVASASAAGAQQTPPFCQGSNNALQFSAAGWICTQIAGVVGPQGPKGDPGPQGAPGPQGPAWSLPPSPPTSQCITAHWDGAQWVC